ncbi:hypothetical protein K1Y38_23135 [Serratia marcescens]|uniref:hypothetical protein n=1 Tax=Serratia TaxID=613 RepID=UPI0002EAC551|nr:MULTISPECIES: hypothetical protein [Serratia]MCW6015673.1 hypothetical protein [Serratia marcescens]UAN29778.1 hypothetical protein KGP23_24250 [Serratia ureilytica]CAB5680647.1 Uncharacterised protein [Serratia marcescens]CAB5696876.1 Uncharacterised protein [Serratia marcescens]HAV2138794.1 hypothetical protein [Serratia marcescens]
MVKRREPVVSPAAVEKRIEEFAAAADHVVTPLKQTDSEAPRDYKAIRVPFNQYEYELLEKLCKKTNRSKLNMIRHALKFYDEHGD